MASHLRLYAVAIWVGIFAVARLLGQFPDAAAVILLAGGAVLAVVSERERQRLVRERRKPYRDDG